MKSKHWRDRTASDLKLAEENQTDVRYGYYVGTFVKNDNRLCWERGDKTETDEEIENNYRLSGFNRRTFSPVLLL